MYIIFIFAAIGVGAPMLFGLSSFLVEVLTKNMANIDLGQTSSVASSMPISFSKVSISSSFVMTYAITSLCASSVLGSFILGLIGKGKESRGIRYIPILLCLSLTVFFVARLLIKGMIGGLFGL